MSISPIRRSQGLRSVNCSAITWRTCPCRLIRPRTDIKLDESTRVRCRSNTCGHTIRLQSRRVILRVDERRLILLAPAVEMVVATYVTEIEIGSEAGGIFIGSHRGPHIEITACTTPLPMDVRRPTVFDRKDLGHQAAALAAWKTSGGTDTYVGEWHTHPVDDPTPSARDLRTWRSILARGTDPVVFLIVGRRSIRCAWGRQGELRVAVVLAAA